MFCFPYPRDAGIEPILVPLVVSVKYSITQRTSFMKFLEGTIETDIQRFKSADSNSQSTPNLSLARSLASAIQAWLFFGVASEALGRDIKYEEFACNASDGTPPTIDLRILEWYWQELHDRWDKLDDTLTAAEYKAKTAELETIYENARLQAGYMDFAADALEDSELVKVLLSVHMMLYLVAHVIESDTVKLTSTLTQLASIKLLKRRMVRNGWCEKRLNFLETSTMSHPALYFLSSIKPPRINPEDHSGCSSERCLVTSKLSKPHHRTDECLCDDIVVPVDRVNTIVASGGIPLVRIAPSPLGKTELEVVPYTPSTKFIAISHVWADRQFGSAENSLPKCQVQYLQQVISNLPAATGGRRAYEYFWLDSFCIPQAVEHADLRSKAIESMNLIYAAASHTLVFDKGLQGLDAGRRPASLAHRGRPTYHSPQNENLLGVIANIYASNWMGRAWTLQEGILSGHIVFPLHGSLAYLKLLWPHHDGDAGSLWEYLVTRIPGNFRRSVRDLFPRKSKPVSKFNSQRRDQSEPLREVVRHQLFTHIKKSLHVEEYKDYARTPADRAARFVKAHSLLQSRTTTQAEDIPLILMNMSCMNANAISQSKSIETRMKQLFYGLESLPTEILFSNCPRLGRCGVDAWIPREIAPEVFGGKHTLKLGPTGFTFETKKGTQPLQFYLLSSARRWNQFQLLLPNTKDAKSGAKTVRHNVEALQTSKDEQPAAPEGVWCIVIDGVPAEKGARFLVNRVVGNKYFLHFDSSLRLTKVDDEKSPDSTPKNTTNECSAVSLNGTFIIDRSYESQELSISRPQNPEQYSDRLIVIAGAIYMLSGQGERYLLRAIWSDENSMSTLFYICYGLFNFRKRQWIEMALNAFVHRAWMATYSPDWNPNGPWKWFWKLSNWEPPVPFSTLMKWWCSFAFFLSFQNKAWSGVATTTLYWLPLYPKQELMNMYLTAMVSKFVLSLVFYR